MLILVLGSEGFIGSHTARYFKQLGHSVFGADIRLQQADDYLLINPEFPDFGEIFGNRQFDVCINASGAANVQLSFEHPQLDFSLNTVNVYAMLDSIRRYNPGCKFINFSSAAVYGNPQKLPISENAELRPLSPYGLHKMYTEQICHEFHSVYNLKTISLRVFSAYGEGLRKQIFWDTYRKIMESQGVITLFGTGKESRDFIYIRDLMFAIECIIQRGEFNGLGINVASGSESTVEEAVRVFIEECGTNSIISFSGSEKKGDPLNWRADISHLQSLGFEPRYSLREGISNYCTWVKGEKLH